MVHLGILDDQGASRKIAELLAPLHPDDWRFVCEKAQEIATAERNLRLLRDEKLPNPA